MSKEIIKVFQNYEKNFFMIDGVQNGEISIINS